MKISMNSLALLFALVVFASSCAVASYPAGDYAERINWREYDDC